MICESKIVINFSKTTWNKISNYPEKSIFKNQKVGIETIILNKFREFKSDLKKLLKLRKNNQSYLDLLHKDKIGDNFTHKSFFKRVQKINKIEKVKNLKFKQVLPEVFLLDRE